MTAVLDVRDLEVTFRTAEGLVSAVRGISLTLEPGRILGVVGESGSGKTVTMLATLGLLPASAEVAGSVKYKGRELLKLAPSELRKVRGSGIAMIFQDPRTSLNPVHTIGHQIVEGIRIHHPEVSRKDALKRAVDLLRLVGIPQADRRANDYPHQFSGGMCQRAMIAMAVANNPDVLVADEPTTALDVTIQAQILALLKELVEESGTALVMITHDLGVVAGLCDEVNVLYAGRIVERGDRHPLFATPRHPYTGGLLESIPRLDEKRGSRLNPVPGSVADNIPWDHGCAFAPRCSSEVDACRERSPDLVQDDDVSDLRLLRCHHPLPTQHQTEEA
ncbi:MAG: ABC transporter ATP-binding protein [Ornithinimicrobium sp.]|uniref:ABC transporter ATP-binding protein n=1 Tax=Ornithinimicrobium sp. TaxID=1977084 RepID=UPI003D9AC2E3